MSYMKALWKGRPVAITIPSGPPQKCLQDDVLAEVPQQMQKAEAKLKKAETRLKAIRCPLPHPSTILRLAVAMWPSPTSNSLCFESLPSLLLRAFLSTSSDFPGREERHSLGLYTQPLKTREKNSFNLGNLDAVLQQKVTKVLNSLHSLQGIFLHFTEPVVCP